MFTIEPSTGEAEPVAVPPAPPRRECSISHDRSPFAIHGELSWLRDCAVTGTPDDRYVLFRGDIDGPFAAGAWFEWDDPIQVVSGGSQTFAATGSRLFETLVRIGSSGVERWNVEVAGSGGTFNLAGNYHDVASGTAWAPAVAPDSGQVAFSASTEAIGHDGTGRIQPESVYVVEPGESSARAIGFELAAIAAIAWSPDESELAITGVDDRGVEGLWIVDVSDGTSRHFAGPSLSSIAWSADGRTIAAVAHLPGDLVLEQLLLLPSR